MSLLEKTPKNFAWTSRWVGRYEASISLIWKFAWVNHVKLSELSKHTTLLASCMKEKETPWEIPLSLSAPTRGRWIETTQTFSLLRSDRIRFCMECLRAGYISSFHQLQILKCCPIHRSLLQANCHCGAPTPGNLPLGDNFGRPFYCGSCGQPLAGLFLPQQVIAADKSLHPLETAFDPLMDWIERLETGPQGSTFPLFTWQSRNGDIDSVYRAGRLLLSVERLHFDTDFLSGPITAASKVALTEQPQRVRFAFESWRNSPEVNDLFHLVRRHIRKRYLRGKRLFWRLYRHQDPLHWNSDVFAPRAGVHPVVHAYWVWRLFMSRYGEFMNPNDPWDLFELGLNANLQGIFVGHELSARSQMEYLLGTYFEFVLLTLSPAARRAVPDYNGHVELSPDQVSAHEVGAREPAPNWYVYTRPFSDGASLVERYGSRGQPAIRYFVYPSREVALSARNLPAVAQAHRARFDGKLIHQRT